MRFLPGLETDCGFTVATFDKCVLRFRLLWTVSVLNQNHDLSLNQWILNCGVGHSISAPGAPGENYCNP